MGDRKYRQAGYQDSNRPAAAGRPDSAPRKDPSLAPKGRGLGAPTATVFRCAACGRKLEGGVSGLDALCAFCGAALHSCAHCASFDTSSPKECRQPIAERVARKADRNRCEAFAPRLTQEFAQEERRATEDPRAAFDALFKI